MRSKTPLVVYWNNEPAPYFVRRMNTLQERGNLAIVAWFNQVRAPERDWTVDPEEWRFRARVLPQGVQRALRSFRLLRQERPDVLVTLYGDYAFASAVLAAKGYGMPVVIHAMRTFGSWRTRSVMREAAKHALFRIVDGVQTAGPSSCSYAKQYGATTNRIFPIREEVDLDFWARETDEQESEKKELRSLHQLSGCVFLYAGRLWSGKGIDSLIDAYTALQNDSVDCSLVLVGSGDDESLLRARTQSLDNVVFTGYLEGAALRAWYSTADVFVFPSLGDAYGHVVTEAMASGLPVIATTVIGDIVDRIVEGQTGFLVEPGDAESLACRMRQLAVDSKLRSRLGLAGKDRTRDWSTELWAHRFEKMIFAVLRDRQLRMP